LDTVIPIAAAPSAFAAPGEMVWMYEAQQKIHPRAVRGWFSRWRWGFVWLTQIVFYGVPWLTWGTRQAVLFDLASRRFYIFGFVLYPQDFIYLTALLVISAYALFFFTTVAGRVWCGYACPQTVYTEMFLWIEKCFEGDRIQRMKLDAARWSANKIVRKVGKQTAWIALGLWTGFTFVGYFTPIRSLWGEAFTLNFGPWEWFWVLFYGFATYGNAGYMREQVCKYMCPYARFQSAMFDKDTLIVSYDTARGEPRGSRPKRTAHAELAAQGKGDCIDCGLCVQVCPTGIDIRQGLQYECIGCAACIDVCDDVMDKMSYPRGLIRYATQNALHERWTQARMWGRLLRPRVLIYGAILLMIGSAFVAGLALRTPLRVDVVRDRGSLARRVDHGAIENTYRLQVMNATEMTQPLRIGVRGIDGIVLDGLAQSPGLAGPSEVEVGPAQSRWVPVNVRVSADVARRLGNGAHPIEFEIDSTVRDDIRVVERSTFLVPR
jgi:cytochrome c oxidase accessory protein FixG